MRRTILSFLLLNLLVTAVHASAGLSSIAGQPAGYVVLPDGAIQEDDFIVAVFAEDLSLDFQSPHHQTFLETYLTESVNGCLSVARVYLRSGKTQLSAPGVLSFPCAELSAESAVYIWKDQTWQEIPFTRAQDGTIRIKIHEMATYAVFKKPPVLKNVYAGPQI